MRKTLIFTEGGRIPGFGHITRCLSLYQAIGEREMDIELIVNGRKKDIEKLLDGIRFRIYDWLGNRKEAFDIAKKADAVIIDSYLAEPSFYENISELAKYSVYLDDNKRMDYPKGTVVNGAPYAEEMDYPKKEGLVYLLGSRYAPIRRDFWNAGEKIIKEKIETIMITFGGNDIRNLTPKVLRVLKTEYPKIDKIVMIGDGYRNLKEIEDAGDEKTKLLYHPDSKSVRETMVESDIAISAGGQTLYELARVGLASIGICTADNQRRNLESMRKKGFVEYIGSHENEDLFKNLLDSIIKLSTYQIRNMRCEMGRSLVDGQGAKRIGEELFKA